MFLCKGILISLLHFVLAAQDNKEYTRSISFGHDLNAFRKLVSTMQGQLKRIDAVIKGHQGTLPPFNRGYIGCFRDIRNAMLSSRIVKGISQITLAKCQHICHGYTFLGLQYSNECFCGNNIWSDRYRPVPERECYMKCSGEDRMCGAGDRNSVYRVKYPN